MELHLTGTSEKALWDWVENVGLQTTDKDGTTFRADVAHIRVQSNVVSRPEVDKDGNVTAPAERDGFFADILFKGGMPADIDAILNGWATKTKVPHATRKSRDGAKDEVKPSVAVNSTGDIFWLETPPQFRQHGYM